MGGNAFNQSQPEAQFPRMQTKYYNRVRSRVDAILRQLYRRVGTPHAAPEKLDHGDIDFVVVGPNDGLSHKDVKTSLGAVFDQYFPGTSNFAIPWDDTESSAEEVAFIQVDVHVCADDEDWERVMFFHSYGDLGMIMGLLARSIGLSVGINGLRLAKAVPTSPASLFLLSSSFPSILEFLGLSMERWSEGFATQRDAFDWLTTSPYFRASWMAYTDSSRTRQRKAKEARGMYQNFLEYATHLSQAETTAQPPPAQEEAIEAALRFFGKWELYQSILHTARVNEHLKEVFNGKIVGEWTGLDGIVLKFLMDGVRDRLGAMCTSDSPAQDIPAVIDGAAAPSMKPWELVLKDMPADDVRQFVLKVKQEMEEDGSFERSLAERRAEKRAKEVAKALRAGRSPEVKLD